MSVQGGASREPRVELATLAAREEDDWTVKTLDLASVQAQAGQLVSAKEELHHDVWSGCKPIAQGFEPRGAMARCRNSRWGNM